VRRALPAIALAAAAAALTLGAGGEERTYRVDAIFDSTANLIPGQDVKIAGARVGHVRDIELTDERKARIQMEIEEGFAPFRADAECTIRPQSLIGEKLVQCDPGSPDAPPLVADGGTATVPLERTHSPVDLDLVFASLRRPYSQRLAILLNELGTGLAGRSGDLNDAVRRANPALQEANDVLAILASEREALGRLVEQSDEIAARVAARRRQAASFIRRADRVSQTVAGRRGELGAALDRMPELLDELEPTADRLAVLASDATPTLRDLRAAAPGAKALLEDFGPVADAARPALVELASASRVGRRAVRSARPVATRLRPVAEILPPIVNLGADLNESLRDSGATENLMLFLYYATAATARFDQFSHILPSYQVADPCQQYATVPVEACSAHFGGVPEAAAAGRRARVERTATRGRRDGAGRRRGGRLPAARGLPPAPGARDLPRLPGLPPLRLPEVPGPPETPDPSSILDVLLGP
jgi:ABC-type transporter Mla subunit MlaD